MILKSAEIKDELDELAFEAIEAQAQSDADDAAYDRYMDRKYWERAA